MKKNQHKKEIINNKDNINERSLDTHIFIEKENNDFILPSEIDDKKNDLLIHDGYLKNNTTKIIKKGSKHNLGDNFKEIDTEEMNLRNSSNLGRKNIGKNWSQDVSNLKKRLGFSWQKLSRKFTIFLFIFAILSIILITTASAVAIDYWNKSPSIEEINRSPSQSSVVYARDGVTKIYEFYSEEKRENIDDIKEIPLVMQLAVVALEDENYFDPSNETGIPWKNLLGAIYSCILSGGDNCRGASGISQQLIKNMTKNNDATIDRKINELFTAIKLNQRNSKTEILLSYLNWVPFGRNAYGVQEASKSYFGRPINQRDEGGNFVLTAPEACYLASMIQSPSFYASGISKLPEANVAKQKTTKDINQETVTNEGVSDGDYTNIASISLEARKDACLNKLRELKLPTEISNNNQLTLDNYIKTDQDLLNLKNQPVASTKTMLDAENARKEGKIAFVTLSIDDPFPHFREYITEELKKFVTENQLRTEGYRIITTLDPNLQKKIEEIIKSKEDIIKQAGGNNASSVVLDGPSGEILAMVGSLGYDRDDIDGMVNIATTAQQPGSSIKPYVYASAFKNGFNPGSIINDVQTTWNGNYTPKNYDSKFRGPVTMARSLQGSLNIPAIKTLFLNNDKPSTDLESKLDSFFSFTDQLGVKFPCVSGASNLLEKFNGVEKCVSTAENGLSQEDIEKAYRGRCFLATAVGGCDLTMLSHIGGINSFLQEGNRTPTPFISIIKKNSGEDIYKEKQASSKPVYSKTDFNEEMRLISRQMTYVMSQYDLRIPEFGNTRFNFELNDKKWKVAAKSGTSNGPKDFWTVGGTPYYAVAVWAGRTDNKDMNVNYSSGVSAAVIWKDIMEYIHAGKEVKNFSTEGLIQTNTSSGNWLLTPKQSDNLKGKGSRVVINTPEDYEKLKKNGIFGTMSSLVPISYNINQNDGKLYVEGKTLPQSKKEVQCNTVISEFTDKNWADPTYSWLDKYASDKFCKIPEVSDKDEISEANATPSINTNITSNSTVSIGNITATAKFDASTKTVTQIKLLVNGNEVYTTNSDNLSYSTASLAGKTVNITFVVNDSNNQAHTLVLNNVTFESAKISANDINVSCPTQANAGSTVDCILNYDSSLSINNTNVYLQIGNSSMKLCSIGINFICRNVSVPSIEGKNIPIYVIINSESRVEKGKIDIR